MQPRVRRNVQRSLVLFSVALGSTPFVVSVHDPNKVGIVILSAWGLSQASLFGAWVVLGTAPMPIRLGICVLAVGWTVSGWATAHGYHHVRAVAANVLLFAAPAMSCAAGAFALRRAGLQIAVEPIERAGGRLSLQISIKSLFLSTMLIAMILAAIRGLPKDLLIDELVSICAVCLAEMLLSLWLCLGRTMGYRLAVAVPLMAVVALPLYLFEGWIVVAVMGMTALFMAGTLLVLRWCGYRMTIPGESNARAETAVQNPPAPDAAVLL